MNVEDYGLSLRRDHKYKDIAMSKNQIINLVKERQISFNNLITNFTIWYNGSNTYIPLSCKLKSKEIIATILLGAYKGLDEEVCSALIKLLGAPIFSDGVASFTIEL